MAANLPSSYYDSLAGLRAMHVSAVCMGVRRSATTVLYQIAKRVFPEGGVLKTHSYLNVPREAPVVLTIRDLRDCAVSWWRMVADAEDMRNGLEIAKQYGPIGNVCLTAVRDWRPAAREFGEEEAVRMAGIVKQDLFFLRRYMARPRVLLLRYEEFVGDLESLRAPLERLWGRALPADAIARSSLRHNWGLSAFTDEVPPTWNADAAAGPVAGGHCHEGGVGVWKSFCSESVAGLLTDLLGDDLREFGYLPPPQSHDNARPSADDNAAVVAAGHAAEPIQPA